jgi:hypothetical protein
MEAAAAIDEHNPRTLNFYFNGGMVGLPTEYLDFLHLWNRIIEEAGRMGVDLTTMMPGTRLMPFHASDQDALNVAAMYTKHPLATMGPEAMGFTPEGVTMYHTVGQKPWRGSLLLRALLGVPPSAAIKFFFTQVSFPIRAYSPLRLRFKRLACAIAALIGRFYMRR